VAFLCRKQLFIAILQLKLLECHSQSESITQTAFAKRKKLSSQHSQLYCELKDIFVFIEQYVSADYNNSCLVRVL
jgi:hypothetical protein